MLDLQAFPDSLEPRAEVLPPAFRCWWRSGDPKAAWVHVAGELDVATAPDFERVVREAERQAGLVVLDLRELAFIDSSGLHAIVNANIRARRLGRRLIVLRGPPTVHRMFTLTTFAHDLEIGDLGPGDPSALALARLAENGLTT
jgi:anti-sigma B factor antagonist